MTDAEMLDIAIRALRSVSVTLVGKTNAGVTVEAKEDAIQRAWFSAVDALGCIAQGQEARQPIRSLSHRPYFQYSDEARGLRQ